MEFGSRLMTRARARLSPSAAPADGRQLAAWRSVRNTTSFWLIVDASRTRSIASKVAVRSVPPWVIARSAISFCTSPRLCEGAPMTTRGGPAHEDHADLVATPRPFHQLAGQRLGPVEPAGPGGRVSHAQRRVQDENPMDPAPDDHDAHRLEERLGHRRDHQQDDQRPHRQQQPLLDPDPAAVLADRREQEAHRRPGHLAVLAPVQEVDQDRDRRRRQPIQERGVRESQGPDHGKVISH